MAEDEEDSKVNRPLPDLPKPSQPFVEVIGKSSGKPRRFAAGTEAGLAVSLINRKLDAGPLALSIEAMKEGEEPVSFGPNSVVVDHGDGRKLQTVNQSEASLDSTAQTGNANSGDWQQEVYQKIKAMKEAYFPELYDMYQKIAGKLLQHDSLPQQPENVQLDKLKIFKAMLERIMSFLQVSKINILPGSKEKLGAYEKQIANFLNSNRPRKQQVQQLLPPHIPPMQQSQQSQSQITQVHQHEIPMNPQLQSLNLQGSVPAMQQNNVTSQPHNSVSSLSGVPSTSEGMINSTQPSSGSDSGQGNTLNALQQVAVGSVHQNPVNASQPVNINSLSSHSGMNVLQPNLTPLQLNSKKKGKKRKIVHHTLSSNLS